MRLDLAPIEGVEGRWGSGFDIHQHARRIQVMGGWRGRGWNDGDIKHRGTGFASMTLAKPSNDRGALSSFDSRRYFVENMQCELDWDLTTHSLLTGLMVS